MWTCSLALAAAAVLTAAAGVSALKVPSFYHTSAEIEAAVRAMAAQCSRTMKVDTVGPLLRVVLEPSDLASAEPPKDGAPGARVPSALLFFGEHARE